MIQGKFIHLISSLIFMSSCSESTFSGDQNKKHEAQTKTQTEPESESESAAEMPESASQNDTQSESNASNPDNSPLSPSASKGITHKELADATIPLDQSTRTVRACFSYDRTKLFLHVCNLAVFDVHFFNDKVGQINLNNFPTGKSVEGGKIDGNWGADGTFTLVEKCALPVCHSDVTFLSLIGEIVDSLGRKKWLKIEQGQIKPDKTYTYKFNDFALSEVEMSFGALCTIVNN